MNLQLTQEEPNLLVQIQWTRPAHTYGQLLSYRLRYGRTDGAHLEELEINPLDHTTSVRNLGKKRSTEIYVFKKTW